MAKRGVGRYNADFKPVDIYNYYASTVEKPKDYKTVRLIWEDFFAEIGHHIIDESGSYAMPIRLGEFRVRKKKMKIGALSKFNQLKIDYSIYNKTGKLVYHLNEHRNGYSYKIIWNKSTSGPIKYKTYYKFVFNRKLKRQLSHILQTQPLIDYFE